MRDIYLFGRSWGLINAFKGLKTVYDSFYVVSNDKEAILQCEGAIETKVDVNSLEGDVLVFSGYGPIITEDVINNNICINIHPSLLPRYRGVHSTVWAILNDEEWLGITVHLMNINIDDGPIISQYKVKNDGLRSATSYMDEFMSFIATQLGNVVKDYLDGKIELEINDKTLATWVGRRHLSDCKIDFKKNIHYQKNFFRALGGRYPLPYFEYKDARYWVSNVDYHYQNVQTHTGRILNIDEEGVWVKVQDGYMILKEIKNDKGELIPYNYFRRGVFIQ